MRILRLVALICLMLVIDPYGNEFVDPFVDTEFVDPFVDTGLFVTSPPCHLVTSSPCHLSPLTSHLSIPPTPRAYLPLVLRDYGPAIVRFAVIGDYGLASQNELDVSNLVKGWDPDFVITIGDNNYEHGAASTIDQNIGQYYHDFIYPYTGSYGAGADTNRFFPSLGNHDWDTSGATPYLNYFTLPGNERYYDFTWGPVRLFAVDSDSHEPDGNTSTSIQGVWLQSELAASSTCWNLVYFHHAPYSSSSYHGSNVWMQWPYPAWGADAILAGHDHTYERILLDGFPYFVNGLGGKSKYDFGSPIPGSQVRYNATYGAMRVTVSETTITYEFIATGGTLVDTYSQSGGCS